MRQIHNTTKSLKTDTMTNAPKHLIMMGYKLTSHTLLEVDSLFRLLTGIFLQDPN